MMDVADSESFFEFERNSMHEHNSRDFVRHSVWVYEGSDIIRVFETEMPNTVEIWFEFSKLNYVFWKTMSVSCLQRINTGNEKISFYNSSKLKVFYIRHLLRGTNYDVKLSRNQDGTLDDDSFMSVMRIHPRILRSVFNKVSFFDNIDLSEDDERKIAKDCALLFGKNEGVMNPHPHIVFYLDLISFWDKFGLNYFDIQRLPYGVFSVIKKMMSLETDFKTRQSPEPAPTRGRPGVGRRKSIVKF